jgi:hypothetical protein
MRYPGLFLLLLACLPLAAQRGVGELRLQVNDAAGLPLIAGVELAGQATQVRRQAATEPDGSVEIRDVPFGVYTLTASRPQFAATRKLVEIRSESPLQVRIQLEIAALGTAIVVTEKETLLDPARTGNVQYVGRDAIRDRRASVPSRAVLELVESQPGWLLEANGVLHPRGSEYNTQYVVDGIPLIDNRSPGFAPPLQAENIQSMKVMTANYPAEYGRKLGGVVEVTTSRDTAPGVRGTIAVNGGSFGTASTYAAAQYTASGITIAVDGSAAVTDRYLDPPTEENYTNHGSSAGGGFKLDAAVSDSDRLRFSMQRRRTGFLVPNEASQQTAGQRQDRRGEESMGSATYQRVLSADSLLHARIMARDISADLWSNILSTPIVAFQDRGLREVYTNASYSRHAGPHEWKAGGEWIRGSLHESFRYRIADPDDFDDDVQPAFTFNGRARSSEGSLYIQDVFRRGRLTLSAGLRYDVYRFLISDEAVSPRLGAAFHWPRAGIVFHASYDRAFEAPAIENLLLSSAAASKDISEESVGLPVPPSRSDFFQAGFTKVLAGRLRLDAAWYRRNTRNYGDDEVLLNTGVSFPVAFNRARISGVEVKLDLPQWRTLSGFLIYSNLNGTGELPLTGGLFLEESAASILADRTRFRITQDQRNTAQGRIRWQTLRRLWLAGGARYGSGLPIELEDDLDFDDYSARILRKVNFERGRVRPSFSLDAALGAELWKSERKTFRLQADVTNMTNRLNVINFAGLFSGTAIGAPRAVSMRVVADF